MEIEERAKIMPIILADVDLWIPTRFRAWLRRLRLKWREVVKAVARLDPKSV
jgi:hypothetical protein